VLGIAKLVIGQRAHSAAAANLASSAVHHHSFKLALQLLELSGEHALAGKIMSFIVRYERQAYDA
jgi:hypothetical protein